MNNGWRLQIGLTLKESEWACARHGVEGVTSVIWVDYRQATRFHISSHKLQVLLPVTVDTFDTFGTLDF